MKPYRLHRCRVVAVACVLVLAGAVPGRRPSSRRRQARPVQPAGQSRFRRRPAPSPSPAAGAFPPPPGAQQSAAVPPAPAPGGGLRARAGRLRSRRAGRIRRPARRPRPGPPPKPSKVCLNFPAIREDVEKGAAAHQGGRRPQGAPRGGLPAVQELRRSRKPRWSSSWRPIRRLCGVPPQIDHAGQGQPRQDDPDPQPAFAAPAAGPAAAPTLERRARRPDHRRRHVVPTARPRHLRHIDGQRPLATMSEPAGRVADATGNWVDTSAPAWARPYLRLTRLDRPIGWWLLLLPCWWSAALAAIADRAPGVPIPGTSLLFLIGAIVMRGAGCTWNDLVDRDIDARVERTRSRPIPSGQVSVQGGGGLPGGAGAGRLAGAGAVQPLRDHGRHRFARRGRDLSVHEALHLLAADFSRAGVLLGRADGLGRGARPARCCRRSCSTPDRSPG